MYFLYVYGLTCDAHMPCARTLITAWGLTGRRVLAELGQMKAPLQVALGVRASIANADLLYHEE